MDYRGFDSEQGPRAFFLFANAYTPVLGPIQTPIKWVPEDFSLGVKRSRR
jgi:hypothetical protein